MPPVTWVTFAPASRKEQLAASRRSPGLPESVGLYLREDHGLVLFRCDSGGGGLRRSPRHYVLLLCIPNGHRVWVVADRLLPREPHPEGPAAPSGACFQIELYRAGEFQVDGGTGRGELGRSPNATVGLTLQGSRLRCRARWKWRTRSSYLLAWCLNLVNGGLWFNRRTRGSKTVLI